MTAGTAACAYLAETAQAYAEYQDEIGRATAGAGARWNRKIRAARLRHEAATTSGGNTLNITARTARSLATTARYLRIATSKVCSAASPLDLLPRPVPFEPKPAPPQHF